jgi:hypothetical protein
MNKQEQMEFYNRAIADANKMIDDAKLHIRQLKRSIAMFEHFRDTGTTFDFLTSVDRQGKTVCKTETSV